jgi:ABC-2 type transport system permease protein
MIGLVRSELLRIRSRRLVWILAILALAITFIGVGIGAARSHNPTASEVAQADREFSRSLHACLKGKFVNEARLPSGEALETWCARTVNRTDFHVSGGGTVLEVSGLADMLKATSFLLIVLGVVIGASSVGADWQSGTMATLLVWEPRRLRVLLVRVAIVMAAVFVLAVLLQVALSLALLAGSALRGDASTPSGFLREVAQVVLRIAAAAAVASSIGVAISSIGRSTAASLGVIFVYLALVESLLRGLVPRLAPWLLSVNVLAVVDGRTQFLDRDRVVTLVHGVTTVGVYAAGLVIIALVFFRIRDVN